MVDVKLLPKTLELKPLGKDAPEMLNINVHEEQDMDPGFHNRQAPKNSRRDIADGMILDITKVVEDQNKGSATPK
jgi:hypothetical protein